MRKSIPIAKEGFPFILTSLAFTFIFSLGHHWLFKLISLFFLVLACFCVYFFRDPERESPHEPGWILAPGDGRVMEVTEEESPDWQGKAKVIKIFLSVFDVHIQRAPIQGKVAKIEYKRGKFLDARHPDASKKNEQNSILIQNDRCHVVVKQIAGLIARRIVCWVQEGQHLRIGSRIGLIRFGSQVDILMPKEVECCVVPGERVVGGKSVIAIKP